MIRWCHLVLILTFTAAFNACSLRQISVRATSELLKPGLAVFEAEPDVALAQEAAASQIKLMETLYYVNPTRQDVLISLTRALGGYAFAFLEWDAEQDAKIRKRAAHLYERGSRYGLELLDLRLKKGLSELARKGSLDQWKEWLKKARKADTPALFWTGYTWANAIRKSAQSPRSVAELPKAVALMERALELDPAYHYGSIHLFFGVYFAERPSLLGGDPKKAETHFTEAARISGGRYLMGKYLWAKTYAVRVQDQKLFEQLLRDVIVEGENTLPEQRLAQEIAKQWAEKLLTRTSDYFGDQ